MLYGLKPRFPEENGKPKQPKSGPPQKAVPTEAN
jgi:hypothetical protein